MPLLNGAVFTYIPVKLVFPLQGPPPLRPLGVGLVGIDRLSSVLASKMWGQRRDAPFEKHKDTKPKKTLYSRIVDSNNHFHHIVLTHHPAGTRRVLLSPLLPR